MNKRYHRLKSRLKYTETCIENFLDVEKHRTISKKARKALNRDKPFLGLIFIVYTYQLELQVLFQIQFGGIDIVNGVKK